jgi:hypothetical protein
MVDNFLNIKIKIVGKMISDIHFNIADAIFNQHIGSITNPCLFAYGLCHIYFSCALKSNDDKLEVLKDIQEVNNIKFEFNDFYKPFYEKDRIEIKTIDELKLWYEKRIFALENTLAFYNILLHKNGQ